MSLINLKGGEMMNMNAVFFQQTPMIDQLNRMQSTKTADVPFRHLIAQASSEAPIIIDTVSTVTIDPSETKVSQLMSWLDQLSEDDLDTLIGWFETEFELNVNNIKQLVTGLVALDLTEIEQDDEMIQQLVAVLTTEEDQVDEESQSDLVVTQNSTLTIQTYLVNGENDTRYTNRTMSESINELINQFDDFSQNDAKQLLDLLRQMQATNEPVSVILENATTQETDQAKLDVFSKVYENFFKKTTLSDQTTYRSDTTVTSKDVLKWVRAALEQTSTTKQEPTNTFGQMFSQQQTSSTIEQLQIQLGQHVETAERVNEQLLTQFEKAISQSRFIQNLSGNNQLLLKLAPESLGTIMVELTEIDGEMLVKLTASSQMAKEALEANVRELRNMFAPHNIVIQKQDPEPIIVEQPSPYEDLPEEQESHEQNQQAPHHDQTDRDDDSIRFEDLLYQERV